MPTYARWRDTWRELGATADEDLYRAVVARYREPQRRYHTLAHLGYCFERFDEARSVARRPAEIELALWFHDAVYDPRRADNEARSADWARLVVHAAGLPEAVADRVQALIMATRHETAPRDADAQLLVDVDLAILGAAPVRFDEYERRIRAEYAWLSDADFRAGRGTLLRRLLARPRIYGTGYFFERCEARARSNLARSLSRLARD